MPPVDPPGTDPSDRDPRESEMSRRSNAPVVSPWLVVVGLLVLAAAIYVVSALF